MKRTILFFSLACLIAFPMHTIFGMDPESNTYQSEVDSAPSADDSSNANENSSWWHRMRSGAQSLWSGTKKGAHYANVGAQEVWSGAKASAHYANAAAQTAWSGAKTSAQYVNNNKVRVPAAIAGGAYTCYHGAYRGLHALPRLATALKDSMWRSNNVQSTPTIPVPSYHDNFTEGFVWPTSSVSEHMLSGNSGKSAAFSLGEKLENGFVSACTDYIVPTIRDTSVNLSVAAYNHVTDNIHTTEGRCHLGALAVTGFLAYRYAMPLAQVGYSATIGGPLKERMKSNVHALLHDVEPLIYQLQVVLNKKEMLLEHIRQGMRKPNMTQQNRNNFVIASRELTDNHMHKEIQGMIESYGEFMQQCNGYTPYYTGEKVGAGSSCILSSIRSLAWCYKTGDMIGNKYQSINEAIEQLKAYDTTGLMSPDHVNGSVNEYNAKVEVLLHEVKPIIEATMKKISWLQWTASVGSYCGVK